MSILLGAIGDDFTGSTDLALTLGKHGMNVLQYIGVPEGPVEAEDIQGAIVALKSRTIPVKDAVQQSMDACDWLLAQGARQILFKYCSTFDSTEKGNIGPVAEALLDRLDTDITVICPAFPANARTVYQGHLFVGEQLLSESGMRHHPLTPMRDANLVRFLGNQVRKADTVGLIPCRMISQGSDVIREELKKLRQQGRRFAVVDAITDQHLIDIGMACENFKLITGGSGIAMGIPGNFHRAGQLAKSGGLARLPHMNGAAVVLAGSCSVATRGQVQFMSQTAPALKLDPLDLANNRQNIESAVEWAREFLAKGPVLIYSSAEPDEVRKAQAQLGQKRAGEIVESTLSGIARRLSEMGTQKIIVAGGETSGAVVETLGVRSLYIGPEIEPGVPWTFSKNNPTLSLALKSGNFGGEDFFDKALKMLP